MPSQTLHTSIVLPIYIFLLNLLLNQALVHYLAHLEFLTHLKPFLTRSYENKDVHLGITGSNLLSFFTHLGHCKNGISQERNGANCIFDGETLSSG